MISASVLTAGAMVTGCGGDPFRNERMAYRPLGKTGLEVSVIGFGGEWMERADQETCTAVTRRCEEHGVNIVDCWMSNPEVRTKLGNALAPHRRRWIIQGHVGSTWRNGQYERTRDLPRCKEAFADLLKRLAVAQPAVPDSVRQHYLALKHHAGECSRCKRCEARCPFHVKVHERMQKAAKLFGC